MLHVYLFGNCKQRDKNSNVALEPAASKHTALGTWPYHLFSA